MVRRVKAGELCGTIAGLPWHQKTRREGKRRRIQQGPGGCFCVTAVGEEFRGELLREEAGQAGLRLGSHQ